MSSVVTYVLGSTWRHVSYSMDYKIKIMSQGNPLAP